ncbi:hypothetical protein C6P42_002030 [Pichia californica]|nr:hypothetical protein C6P42_002030 [[Candida] californica]
MSAAAKDSDLQHDKLRKRLEEELSFVKSSSDSTDYDWFLRSNSLKQPHHNITNTSTTIDASNTSSTPSSAPIANSSSTTNILTHVTPLKSPTLATANNTKALPTLTLSNPNDPYFLVNLSRSRTADAKLIRPISRTSTNSSNSNTALHRTSTNVDTSDIGRSRNKKPYTPLVSNSTPLSPPTEKKKKGFFKKIFGSKSDDSKPDASIYKTTSHVSIPSHPTSNPISRTTSRTEPSISRTQTGTYAEPSTTKLTSPTVSRPTSPQQTPISRSNTITRASASSKSRSSSFVSGEKPQFFKPTPIKLDKVDPLTLAEQYKDVDSQLSSYINELEKSNSTIEDRKIKDEKLDYNFIYSPAGIDSIKYNPDEIPDHPDIPKLPSSFSRHPRFGGSIEKELFLKQRKEREEKENSMFGSLLHKTKTTTPESLFYSGMINESDDTPPFSFEPLKYAPPPPRIDRRPPLETFDVIKPMKKVAFATTTFVTDPPQQIPSRNPRKGNVEICANGELIIHKIDPQEKLNAATGIVVGGSGPLRLISEPNPDVKNAETSNLQIDVPNVATTKTTTSNDSSSSSNQDSSTPAPPEMKPSSSTMSVSSVTTQDQTIKSEDRALAAQKAREHHEGLENIDLQKESLKIDKPMVKRKKQMEKPVVTLKLDELYTRCCHLREILPIPATLKQIPKGSTDPIPYLHLRNPRPSMIEILSFTDFIRIAPIICVSLDGVSLTREMFRIILSSLLYKRYLEKLSLRNTSIDEEGWKMLCLFLSMNKALRKLDITQCLTLDVNTQRIKKKSKPATENRMVSNINDRSDENWALLTASLIYRGGIDEMILTGCKIPDLKLFSNLLNLALVKTHKIGLSFNDLSLQHCYVVARWLESNPTIIGIDLAYNDLSSKLKPFIDYANDREDTNNLVMLSLNSCNLLDCEETNTFFNVISKLPRLQYLDISGNDKLMKTFINKLSIYLPLFHNLARLNIDNNKLNEKSLVRFLETVPLIPNLNYLSITGNEMNDTVAEALCKALRSSKTLYSVIFDETLVSSEFQEKIGLLTMRNVERQLYKKHDIKGERKSFFDTISDNDKESIKKDLGLAKDESFIDALYDLIKAKNVDDAKLDKFLVVIGNIRSHIKQLIQDLINSNVKNELNIQGKEVLIRLMTMNASMEKGLELINNKKLNSLRNDKNSFDLSKYEALAKTHFERGTEVNPLDEIIKDIKANGTNNCENLKSIIMSTNDPYNMISMLKSCKANNINISDLFLKKYSDAPLDVDIDDDDASIDSIEIEATNEDTTNEDNKILKIYDLILKDLITQSKA